MTTVRFMRVVSLGIALVVLLIATSPALCAEEPATHEPFSFVQICDIQLGMAGYEHDIGCFEQAVKQVNELKPDFVLICGDLVNKANDQSFADFKSIGADFSVPSYCAAGNHDIGNQPTTTSLQRYRQVMGKDYYSFEHKGYTFVVVNTQLWKAPLKAESERHEIWFQETLKAAHARKSPIIVVGHYPLYVNTPDEAEGYFNLPVEKRTELLGLFTQYGVIAMLGGHTHKTVLNDYHRIQLVNAETTSNNFDQRPLGFRLWQVASPKMVKHEFIPLKENEGK